ERLLKSSNESQATTPYFNRCQRTGSCARLRIFSRAATRLGTTRTSGPRSCPLTRLLRLRRPDWITTTQFAKLEGDSARQCWLWVVALTHRKCTAHSAAVILPLRRC